MPVRRLVVFVNAEAGSVDDADTDGSVHRIGDAFTKASGDVDVHVEAVDPARLQERIVATWSSESRPDAVVVAGGDGTVNNAAQAAAGSDIVIGVLPLGTFDHFAGDLGVPGDLEAAASALADGEIRRVDVGEVNGRVFVNNSLVGLYPRLVAIRDEVMDDRGWGKVRAVPVAAARVLGSFPTHRLDLSGPDGFGPTRLATPMLFVGNGVYESAPGRPPTRTRLDAGVLGVEVARAESRRRLFRAAVHTLIRGASGATDVERASLQTFEVDSRAARLQVAIDGEIDWFVPPLRYRTRPGALLVLAPRRPASP